jgi:hypothetical protein
MSIFPPALPDAFLDRHPSDRVAELRSNRLATSVFRVFCTDRAEGFSALDPLFVRAGGAQ